MCDDSRSEKRYWMRRVDELRQQMEREERERQRRMAAARGCDGIRRAGTASRRQGRVEIG